MINLNSPQSTTLASEYLERLTNEEHGFISPRQNLLDWINEGTLVGNELNLARNILDRFDEIITGDPATLRLIINDLNKVIDKRFSNDIVKRMRYDKMRTSSRGRWLARQYDIKACPYCNAQFSLYLNKKGKILYHFDHIYPKSIYPYLCISFFNLVPSCSSCNQMKSNIDTLLDGSFVHPFEGTLATKFKIYATTEAISKYHLNGRSNKGDDNILIEVQNGENITFHDSTFHLREVYNEHNDIIDEMYLKTKIYNLSYINELKKKYVDEMELLTEEELKRAIYGTYMMGSEINKRPLSKMIQDLKDQFDQLAIDL